MQIRTTLLAATTLLALTFALPGQAAIKCWTNSDGIRECGNEVPPEYSQGETETINKEGYTTKVDKRAKTPAELEAERRKKEEEAARAAEEKRQKEKQAAYDRVLLATYLTEDDIVRARNRRTTAIDASVEVTKATMAKLQERLDATQQRNDNLKKNGRPVSKDDEGEVDSLKQQIANKQAYIDAKQKEKEAILAEFDGYIKRFRELKGIPASK